MVWVVVFEKGRYREDLSSAHHFKGYWKQQDQAIISLDSRGTTLDVFFVPFGKQGASAKIFMTTKSPQ
jgi:hypothetical protein